MDLPAIEAELVQIAGQVSSQRLRAAVHFYTERLDPDGAEPDPTEGRALTLSRLLEGQWHGAFVLNGVGGEKLATAIEAIAAASRCAGDLRTAAQRRGDALVQLADLALACGQLTTLRTVKPHVVVTIPLTDLVDPTTDPGAARTGLDADISAARARRLACDSTVSRIVLTSEGLPTDLGRTHRVVPAHLRRAVVEGDRGCVFTGCEAPHRFCDVHHLLVDQRRRDQPEELRAALRTALAPCVHHGFRVERDDGAPPGHAWRTYRPDGTEILVHPPLLAA